jgi:hypothetical protein
MTVLEGCSRDSRWSLVQRIRRSKEFALRRGKNKGTMPLSISEISGVTCPCPVHAFDLLLLLP